MIATGTSNVATSVWVAGMPKRSFAHNGISFRIRPSFRSRGGAGARRGGRRAATAAPMVGTSAAAWDRASTPRRTPRPHSARQRTFFASQAASVDFRVLGHARAARPGAAGNSATPAAKLRGYVYWFMTGERLEQRLHNSDGSLSAIRVEWPSLLRSRGGAPQALVELRFSNGQRTTPLFPIDGLSAEDVEMVAAEMRGATPTQSESEPQSESPLDPMSLCALERRASCKLSDAEAVLLQNANEPCAICLGAFEPGHTILCLPCGRGGDSSACLGHLGHLKCLRAEFRRRDACPLCRARVPKHDDSDGLARAQSNLQQLCAEAVATAPPAETPLAGGGAPAGRRTRDDGETSATASSAADPPLPAGARATTLSSMHAADHRRGRRAALEQHKKRWRDAKPVGGRGAAAAGPGWGVPVSV